MLFKGQLHLEDINLEQSITTLSEVSVPDCVVMEIFPDKEESHKKQVKSGQVEIWVDKQRGITPLLLYTHLKLIPFFQLFLKTFQVPVFARNTHTHTHTHTYMYTHTHIYICTCCHMWEQEKCQFYNMESNVVVVMGAHSGV